MLGLDHRSRQSHRLIVEQQRLHQEEPENPLESQSRLESVEQRLEVEAALGLVLVLTLVLPEHQGWWQ